MSFILDALKKSENERQRQSGPALFEAKMAPPKARWPAWAFALGGLLIVNMGVVGWLMLRQPSRAAVPNAAPAAGPQGDSAPPTAATVAPPAPQTAPASPPAGEAASATETAGGDDLNPDDYVPAAPATAEQSVEGGHVTRGTVEGLPTYDQVAGSGIPELRLDLHVYAAAPPERFILLNMRRLREGDTSPENVHVESITPTGAILSYRGNKFVLERE